MIILDKDVIRNQEQPTRSKMSFRELHVAFGRKVLADKNEWRMKKMKPQESPDTVEEVPALIQL